METEGKEEEKEAEKKEKKKEEQTPPPLADGESFWRVARPACQGKILIELKTRNRRQTAV